MHTLKNFLFYTYKKLQGSQTTRQADIFVRGFYTYKKLQGSQTTLELV